jgi:ABC-type sugar transport system ATPase subunit
MFKLTHTPDHGRPVVPESGSVLIEMRSISKRFGGVHALTNVNFSIQTAEIHSLVGENGSGKSTLVRREIDKG